MIAPTWEAHCEQYVPGRYSKGNYGLDAINRDADSLTRVLTLALARLIRRAYGTAA